MKTNIINLLAGLLFLPTAFAFSNGTDEIITGYNFDGNGFQAGLPCFDSVFKQQTPKYQLTVTDGLINAIDNQSLKLKKGSKKQTNNTLLTTEKRLATLSSVKKQLSKQPNKNLLNPVLLSGLKYHLVKGEDGCGNSLLTGYYTPIIKLKKQADKQYKYPLYTKPSRWPNNQPLTRDEIDNKHKLQGQGLEIGYSDSLLANYFVHIQGSTIATFVDSNETVTLQYSGKNGLKYESLGKYLVNNGYITKEKIGLASIEDFFNKNPNKLNSFLTINPSYVFFAPVAKQPPVSASGTPAIKSVTVAVDPTVIPFGSLLLIEYPIVINDKVTKREYRIVVANDRGSAIKGTGHIDIYQGLEKQAAGQLHHYGRVWLIEAGN